MIKKGEKEKKFRPLEEVKKEYQKEKEDEKKKELEYKEWIASQPF